MQKSKSILLLAILGSLTLGLAPFSPEPHIWKQLMNISLGKEMLTIDWFDLLMHGAPWLLLIVVSFYELWKRVKNVRS